MDGPWTKYQKAEGGAPTKKAGPWTKYGAAPAPEPGVLEKITRAAVMPVQTIANVIAPGSMDASNAGMANIARPALEIGGALGGAALAGAGAIPLGPVAVPAAAVGGALGMAGGSTAADALERALGIKQPLNSAADAVKEIGGNLTSGVVSEATGAAAGKALKLAAPYALRAGKFVGKKTMTAVLGPSGKAIEDRFARNVEVQAAKPIEQLAQDLPDTVQELRKIVGKLSGDALDTLSHQTTIGRGGKAKDELFHAIEFERQRLGDGISDATSRANEALDRYVKRLHELPPNFSEKDLGKMIRDFDHDINWDKTELAPTNQALEGVRVAVDTMLKSGNAAYAKAMIPVARGTRTLVKAKQLFNLKNDVGNGLVPGNNTATALTGAAGETRLDSREVLDELKHFTGRDYLREVENSITAGKFVGGKANGSRRAVPLGGLGAGLGAMVGGPAGATVGAAGGTGMGWYLDTEGHRVAGNIIDELVRLSAKPRTPMPSEALQRAISAAVISNAKRQEGKKR